MGSMGPVVRGSAGSECQRLLDAALRLAETADLATLALPGLALRAGVSAEAAASCFDSRAALLLALHREYLDRLLATISWHMAAVPPGIERFQQGVSAFLDHCLQHASLRLQLLSLELSLPELAGAADARRSGFHVMLAMELATLGVPDHAERACMLRIRIEELSRIEIGEGRPLPGLRDAIWHFLTSPANKVSST